MDTFSTDMWDRQNTAAAQAGTDQNAGEASGYWQNQQQKADDLQAKRQKEIDRYGVDLPQNEYEILNQYISTAEDPQEASYRMGTAVKYSQMFGVPLSEAVEKEDSYNEAIFGERSDSRDARSWHRAVCDAWDMGVNTMKQSSIGLQFMRAELAGWNREAQGLMQQYRAIDKDNQGLQDSVPRSWTVEAMKFGAQSLPFTAAAIGAGILPGIGTAAAFGVSAGQTMGLEYMNLRADGASPEVAGGVAAVSGGLQGLVEIYLGNVASAIRNRALDKAADSLVVRGMNKLLEKTNLKPFINEMTEGVYKRLHYSGAFKVAAHLLMNKTGEDLEEGAEEVVQQLISDSCRWMSSKLSDYNVPDDIFTGAEEYVQQFRGGFMGSILLSVPNTAFNAAATAGNFADVKNAAETVQSQEAFKESVKDSPIFEGMKPEEKTKAESEIWNNFASKREANADREAADIAEVTSAADGMEEIQEDDDGNEVVTPAVFDEGGKLHEEDKAVSVDDDGTAHGLFSAGNPEEKEKNTYGTIAYTESSDGKTVTIDSFKMAAGREGLRQQLYSDFAEKFAGEDIQWNPQGERGKAIKADIMRANPRAGAGLNYFADVADIADGRARISIGTQLHKYMPKITNEQLPSAISLAEYLAKGSGKSISQFIDDNFSDGKVLTDTLTGENAEIAQAQSGTVYGATQFMADNRAVIYATKNSDFNTWAHELFHVAQHGFTDEENVKIEAVIGKNVADFTTDDFEKCADMFVDYLRGQQTQHAELKNVFQKVAQFIAGIFRGFQGKIAISKDISDTYDALLRGDGSELAAAEQAVSEAEKQWEKNGSEKTEQKKPENKPAGSNTGTGTGADGTGDGTGSAGDTADTENKNNAGADNGTAERSGVSEERNRTHLSADAQKRIDDAVSDPEMTSAQKAAVVTDETAKQYMKDAAEELLFQKTPSHPWTEEQKEVVTNGTYEQLDEDHGQHSAAKKGDTAAAAEIVKRIVKPEVVRQLAEKYPDAIVVPAPSMEEEGKRPNALPRLYAQCFENKGLKRDSSIIEIKSAHHTKADVIQRITVQPEFDGKVEKGRDYILVDDVFTMGGTLNALRNYIEDNGGKVVAMTTLTPGKRGNKIIAITDATLERVKKADPDGELLNAVRKLGIADNYETLTEPVGDFLADLRPEQRRSILDKAGAGRTPGGTEENGRRSKDTHEGLEVDSGSDNLKNNSTDPSILFQSIGPDGAQQLDQTEETKEYNPRRFVPKVRGGWTESKIIRYLKEHQSLTGYAKAARIIAEFNSVEDLKKHMFYHGTPSLVTSLKPSILFTESQAERMGGGGYGDRQWGISVTKDKKIASNFSSDKKLVNIYPIVLAKNAVVEQNLNAQDAVDIGKNIVNYWNRGVDAVWIGNGESGEKELLILNPSAIVNIGTPDSYAVYHLENVNIKDDAEIAEMLTVSKEYVSGKYRGVSGPRKPFKPFRFDDSGKMKSDDVYQKEIEEYNQNLEKYDKEYADYVNSERYKKDTEERRYFEKAILFQTEDELAKDASTFDTWQDFMEYYQGWVAPADAFIPSDADAAWFQNYWQNAKNIHPTLAEAEDARLTESEKQDEISQEQPEVKDAYFTSMIGGKGKLESFLTRVQQVLDEVPASNPEDETEAAENDKLLAEQRFIRTQLAHGTWLSNAMRVAKGGELTQQTRARMLTLIRKAARDYRGIYSVIMDDPSLAVSEYENFTEKLAKNDLASGEDTILTSSPEQRRKLAEKVKNREIAQKIRDGTLKLNDDVSSYVENLQRQIKESDKKLQDLTDQTKEDYQRISDWQQRQILDKYDELQRAKLHYPSNFGTTAWNLAKGLKIGKKYDEYQSSGFTADYDTLFRQYSDLLSATQISEELKATIRQKDVLLIQREKNHDLKQEYYALEQMRDMRKQLVKRTMRRVDFKRIDYENAKTVIAIQRIFEPNLFGGVNKWLKIKGSLNYYLARRTWSEYSTDADARDRITKLLGMSTSGRKLIKLLEDTKTEKDFDAWPRKDRQRLCNLMSSENWIRELNLQDLADERENSIQLDIDIKDNTRTYTDQKTGKQMTEVQSVATFSPDIEKMVRDALGPDTFENLVHRPFAEWTTEEMEDLARKVDKLYTEGRGKLAARKQAEKEHARAIRDKIEANVKNVGIQVNPDDPDDVKKKKLEAINRKLGLTSTIKGTVQDATKRESILNRVQHFYGDANIRRVARILDNYSEGVNTNMLFWRENECYKAQESQIQKRTARVLDAMKKAGVTMPELFETVTFENFRGDGVDVKLTRDELLFYLAASEDEHSRDACAYGSMIDERFRGKYRDMDAKADAEEAERLKNLKDAEKRGDKEAIEKYSKIDAELVDVDGKRIPPGTAAYKADCDALYNRVLDEAQKLDKKYLSLLKAVQDDYTESFDRLNKSSIDEFNAPVWRVDKYVPLIRLSTTGDTNENRVRQDLMGLDPEAQKRAGVDKGTSVKRIDISPLYQRPVEAGLYKTWADSVQRNEHFIAYAGYVRELNAVYGSRDASGMKQWIESRYGKGMTNYIANYINEVADPDAGRQQSELDKMVRTLRGHTAPAYLAWKASSIVKQAITSPAPFFQFVTPIEYAATAKRMMNGKTADFIREKSVFMANRVYDPMIDLVNENVEKSTNKAAYTLHQFQATGMKGLEIIDWACVAPGWLAVYDKEHAKIESEAQQQYEAEIRRLTEENTGKTGEDRMSAEKIQAIAEQHRMAESDIDEAAVNKADDCTRLCQPSDRSTDLAPLFKTKGKNSEVVHALLQFQTSLNVIWQNIRYDIPYAARQKQYRQIVGMVAGYMFAGIALGMVCDKPDSDDDKEKKIRKFVYDSTTQFSDSVPVIGAGISALNEKMITGHGGWQSGNDIFPMLTKYSQAAGAFTKGDWEKACGRFAEGTGLALGLPVSGLKEAGTVAGMGEGGPDPGALLGRR